MKCPKCNCNMYISAWDGWIWLCYNCDYHGRRATDEEIEEDEKQELKKLKEQEELK